MLSYFWKVFLKTYNTFSLSVRTFICGTNMPKEKGRQRGMSFFPKIEAHEIPFKDCKNFLIEFLAKFYKANTLWLLESKYMRFQEESLAKFKREIRELNIEALQVLM